MKASDLGRNRVMLILSGIMMGVLMSSLDTTIVGTAMPKIIQDLKGMEHYSWPFTAYMLLSTLSVPIFGKLADIFGRKLIYQIGIFTFLAASILCGLSQNMIQLILFRGLQGIGGGILVSNAFAIVGEIFPPRERGKYTGLVASMFGLSSLLGPSVGGLITDALNWRWVFYVNVPIALIALSIVGFALPGAIEHKEKRSVDFAGIGALIAAFAPMLLAFSWAGKTFPWLSPQILGMLIFSLVMLVFFAMVEKGAKEPIIPLSLFKKRVFNVSVAAAFLSNAAMFGAIIFIPLYVQGVKGYSPAASGLITTPMMLTFTVFSILAGQLISKTGKYKTLSIAGFLVAILGMGLLAFLGVGSPNWFLMLGMVTLGAGLGINMPIYNLTVQSAFPVRQVGMTTAAVQFFRNIGGTIGSAVLGSVLMSSMGRGIQTIRWGDAPDLLVRQLNQPQLLSNPSALTQIRANLPQAVLPFFDRLLEQVRVILLGGLREVFILGILLIVLALLPIVFHREIPLSHAEEDQPVESCDGV